MSKDHIDPIINKKIGSTLYYYNVEPTYFDDMSFWEAISMREFLAKKNLKRLLHLQSQVGNDQESYFYYEEWINDVSKAIEFNRQLLEERRKIDKNFKI